MGWGTGGGELGVRWGTGVGCATGGGVGTGGGEPGAGWELGVGWGTGGRVGTGGGGLRVGWGTGGWGGELGNCGRIGNWRLGGELGVEWHVELGAGWGTGAGNWGSKVVSGMTQIFFLKKITIKKFF